MFCQWLVIIIKTFSVVAQLIFLNFLFRFDDSVGNFSFRLGPDVHRLYCLNLSLLFCKIYQSLLLWSINFLLEFLFKILIPDVILDVFTYWLAQNSSFRLLVLFWFLTRILNQIIFFLDRVRVFIDYFYVFPGNLILFLSHSLLTILLIYFLSLRFQFIYTFIIK